MEYPAIAKIIGRGVMEQEGGGPSQALFYGSGVYVAEQNEFGIVLTNWHVVSESSSTIEVQFPSCSSPGLVILADEIWDLAAVVVRKPPFLPIPISLEVPQIGETLWVAGYGQYPGLNGFQMQRGAVLQYMRLDDATLPPETLALNIGVREGDSGGPILNRYGELSGILWGSDSQLTMGTFCLRLQAFLTQAQYRLMKQPLPIEQFLAAGVTGIDAPGKASTSKPNAVSGESPLKKIVMPSTPAQVALQASGIFPISTKPVYLVGGLDRKSRDGSPALITQTSAASELPARPPYPPIASPTLLAQQKTIGRDHPEVYPESLTPVSRAQEETPVVLASHSPEQAPNVPQDSSPAHESTNSPFRNVAAQQETPVATEQVSPNPDEVEKTDVLSESAPEPTKLTIANPNGEEKKGPLAWFGMNDIQTIIVVIILVFFLFNAVKLIAIANQ
ncbi:MAG: trypsin-like peptidase domain-containing protein [Planctomycetia bacterium]|nr:trypsin-like peptidase domain-containing protein [Planctomycetia bacterium]